MKKILIAALAAATFATPALAATDSTIIAANVPAVCTIDGPANNGAIALSGTTALGNISLECNDPQGFTATASSANGGKLKDSSGGLSNTNYDYTLTVPVVGTFSLASDETFLGNTSSVVSAAIGGVSVPVSVTVGTRHGLAFAGYYSDTITWTITAN